MTLKKQNLVLNDLASELGLSKSTVSRAISGNGRVSGETRKRVLEYAESHGFTPNSIASSLARSCTNNIGVVIPSEAFYNEIPFFQECLMGVCEAASKRNYDVLIATIAEGDISVLKRIVSNRKVDGILLTRSLVVDYPADFLKAAHVPFVTVGTSNDPGIVQVDTDTVAACRTLTKQILQFCTTRAALILGSLDYIVNKDRLEGFSLAFQDAGRELDLSLVFSSVTGGKSVKEACVQAAANGAKCIICGDDFICAKVVEQLIASGITEIRVSSFYNSDIIRNLPFVGSVVSVDVRSYGIAAGETLIRLLEHEPIQQKTFVPHTIVNYHS
ncbi:MAG: LacI family DNA-binding transcriptional regulator [Clostridiaceae bacterium]